VNISTERTVTSLRHEGARLAAVSVNHWNESAVGSAAATIGFSETTGTMAGAAPVYLAARSPSNALRNPAIRSARTSARMLSCPLIIGTWLTTAFTRRSIAPTISTCPPE
jgi:hypothetical protein